MTDDTRKLSRLNLYVMLYESSVELRKETMNRVRNWLRDQVPKDQWEDTDFSDDNIKDVERLPLDLREFVDNDLRSMEKGARKLMKREVEKHPLYLWLDNIYNINHNLAAKLLHRLIDKEFPKVSALWSYAGLDGPGWQDNSHNWNLTSICYLIGKQFERTPRGKSKYRDVYDKRKEYEYTKPWCGKKKGNIAHTNLKDGCRNTEIYGQGFTAKIEKIQKMRKNGNSKEKEVNELEAEIAKIDIDRKRCTKGHRAAKARRYAVKEFLKDLWLEVEGNFTFQPAGV